MSTALFSHPDCLLHCNGPSHPETPERISHILNELKKPEYAQLKRFEAPLAAVDDLARVHDRHHIDFILNATPKAGHYLVEAAEDPDLENEDTMLCNGSDQAALRAAGAVIAAVDLVLDKKADNAFCAIRPPGHHAGHSTSEGFCLFNNIAIGAEHAIQKRGINRIAILDIDVHHGNGTQEWAEKQPKVLFASTHQWPLYPGSGRADEQGPLKNIINIPLPRSTEGTFYRHAISTQILPAFDAFAPELILLSAGFDSHANDPLGGIQLIEDDYSWLTRELVNLARKHSVGIVSALEGGYNCEALATSVGAHIRALMEG